jgi:tRNA delta(2)-isopentenylpyrophosphate transferase
MMVSLRYYLKKHKHANIEMSNKINLIVILGPTACGKTSFATQLAYSMGGEIISADSRQVYRQMNLGTGKDLEEYTINGQTIPYHLIDIAEPGYKYNVFEYQADFFKAFETVTGHNHWPIMCGGTGLYIEAVLKKYKLINVPVNEMLRNELKGKGLHELTSILAGSKICTTIPIPIPFPVL